MIGGIVTETITLSNRVWINTVERDERLTGHCAIFVERNSNSEQIKPGDSVWWQSGSAMWTPYANCGLNRSKDAPHQRGGVDYDIRIPRIGFSGVSRPEKELVV